MGFLFQSYSSTKTKVGLPTTESRNTTEVPKKNKIILKDVILIPSPKIATVPKGVFREELYDCGFGVTGYELHTNNTEHELRSKLNELFKDIFNLRPERIIHFDFVQAVEKGLFKIKTDGTIDGNKLSYISGKNGRNNAIYIRAKSDFRHLLTSKTKLCPSEIDTSSSSESDTDDKDPKNKNTFGNKDTYENKDSDVNNDSDINNGKCPVCDKNFLMKELAVHASSCGELAIISVPKEKHRPPSATLTRPPATSITPPSHLIPTSSTATSRFNQPASSHSSTQTSSTATSISGKTPPLIVTPKPLTFQSELKKLQRIFQNQEEERLRVRITHAYQDLEKKCKLFFQKNIRPITVSFFEEAGVDDGGLTRELFCKVFGTAINHLLCGMPNRYTLQHDIFKLENKIYFYYGRMISLSLLLGAPGPHNFSLPFAQFILGKEPQFEIEDVPSAEVQEKLREITECETKEMLDEVMATFDQRFEAG